MTNLNLLQEDLPSQVKIRIPEELPITSKRNLFRVKDVLRTYYNFDKIPENYFHELPTLPEDPKDLKEEEFRNFFPITIRSNLKYIKKYKDLLRKKYFFKGKLPKNYFKLEDEIEDNPNLPALPENYKDLKKELIIYFPHNKRSSVIELS